jgi:hypothetical protein
MSLFVPLLEFNQQREKGMTDFNDFALENGRLAKQQLEEAVWRAGHKGDEQTAELGKGLLRLDSWAPGGAR